ncbi:DUF1800 domain-containing protein [Streptomyces pakalii]|uniref:DUF1800 family protein n=1 Tax=Streptomyces pakalii TaxID=3036494 RepID=A0ABT7DC37_9ACTN|nr:DUF1800 family protein [Streptomyces pakalii]MDJ1643380.1 DUF1800 family protein [Streptomyces pakalii]
MGRTLDTRARVTRLLQRTGFDAGADAVDTAARAGFDATLDRVLGETVDGGVDATPAPRLGPLPPRNAEAREKQKGRGQDRPAGSASDPAPPVPGASGTADAARESRQSEGAADPVRKAYRQALREQREELTVWWLDRMVAVEHPWEEKRTLLWHNHWAASIQKVKSGAAMLQQNETLRRLGGGDFRALARAMVVDPALMVWLDAGGSTAKAPNENLARELMELFVLGVGNYTETDVRQSAAVLTGWTVDRSKNPWEARFRSRRHDPAPRTVVGVKAGFTAQTLVDHLVSLPDSHAHVAARMWRALVSAEKGPDEAALGRVTAAYGKQRDSTAMFRALFTDAAFSDADNVLVKQPVEYVVGSLRALGVRPSELPEKARRQMVIRTLSGLGQVPFAPESVGGWPAGAAWLTTAAAQVRIGFAEALVRQADLSGVERASAGERPELLARMLGTGGWGDATRKALAASAQDPRKVTAIALTAPEHLVLS